MEHDLIIILNSIQKRAGKIHLMRPRKIAGRRDLSWIRASRRFLSRFIKYLFRIILSRYVVIWDQQRSQIQTLDSKLINHWFEFEINLKTWFVNFKQVCIQLGLNPSGMLMTEKHYFENDQNTSSVDAGRNISNNRSASAGRRIISPSKPKLSTDI